MYLKSITISGFKSFADKVNIDLTSKVTGVVGPNGSGKSNIVDAIRWVLGEQSVKSLRGDGSMTDVIFSGSKSRKPSNYASVALLFDNTDRYLNIDYNEVEIKRRLYKDSTNEFSINGEKCRLKDVLNLFLDTGIAKESFNIISQGKVSEIVVSKPTDRRVIIEEVAEVLKYKKRKEEALRKLDKTNTNISRVNDIISELSLQVEPLREQKEKAVKFNTLNEQLSDTEISLISYDISNLNEQFKNNKAKIDSINDELLTVSSTQSNSEVKQLEHKNKLTEIETKITELQKELLEKTKEVEQVNSEKNILLERKKYEVEDAKLFNNIVELKEQSHKISNQINEMKTNIDNKEEEIKDLAKNISDLNKNLSSKKESKDKNNNKLGDLIRRNHFNENKIESLKENIENNNGLPRAVKNVLNNKLLEGIVDIIGNVIQVDEKYSASISIALSSNVNNVIVDNPSSAKKAIKYLQEQNIGRATFFPIDVIKARYVDPDTIEEVSKLDGFINIASKIVQFDKKYKNIVENQLGNILVVDNIDNANKISKKIHNRYRIVTLDGSVVNVGGSLTGGYVNNRNVITDKFELEQLIKENKTIKENINELENKINDNDYELKALEDKIYLLNKELILKEEENHAKNKMISESLLKKEEIDLEIKGIDNLANKNLESQEEQVINKYYELVDEKNKISNELEKLTKKRNDLNYDLEEVDFALKQENSRLYNLNKSLSELEIKNNRIDVKLDTLLTKLNETYNMTYENAVLNYVLELDPEEARNKVTDLKRKINDLGSVNLGSIEEFDRINERYQFLIDKKTELNNAIDTLLEIIKEMDEIMISSFEEAFETVKKNFTETFKELFKGGNATLKLTDPDNLLETGIEIVASPPGKSLKSISLLSGGEITLTAISLLFAVLKSRPVPFCVLDEIEAALDEVNVDSFGEYLNKYKKDTQFILITHKKKTMEFVDVLYGITMQESGVSKLVSVKLEDIK